ncbi:MAG: monovalent cation/H+ antiporter subunit D [Sterolibacterium sp.]|nr:monovalent cation/H+ antiporter subunit D [Sterolibacterium sp.]
MTAMTPWLPLLPILLPLLAGSLSLLLPDNRPRWRQGLGLFSCMAQWLVALQLLQTLDQPATAALVHELGGWAAPYGIVLVADPLAALMLLLTATLGLTSLVYALAHWERAGSHFLTLFQFQLLGLNGAFLTGDLFNLFVFFEILLAASYGLLLHGSGLARAKAGLHYIAVNLIASLLFLIAAALIYGSCGTLNLAALAVALPQLQGQPALLFDIAAWLLGLVFLIKAAAWPLNFWLPATYAAAAPPVAGLFVILSKVGIYALLRGYLLFGAEAAPAPFNGDGLFYCGLATLAVGTLGVLAAQQLKQLAGQLLIVSAGTLLAALGFSGTALTAPALYYLTSSILAASAFYMLIELAERNRQQHADFLSVSFEALGLEDRQASDHPEDTAGVAIPASMAFLGLAFYSSALILSGLPPLSGFIAKFALLQQLLAQPADAGHLQVGLYFALLLLSGLAGLIAMSRLGIRVFWDVPRKAPRLQWLEALPIVVLLGLCALLVISAGPALDYFSRIADSLHQPARYIDAVLPAVGRP